MWNLCQKHLSGKPANRPVAHKNKELWASTITSEPLKVVSAAEMAANKRRRF